ncbi:hypothetical protein [Roseimicrobium sp. ORNL1]|uniref:hypothetical protein n=1 Tax=Roseimicrobium sp. ORNL1 TaxID=2711231 RepID=UPI0013E1B6A0|nr:hypothetical protein [Roseimicrobium sp. ORNL1]QIF05127.1 hypothetical protein G5S37_27640 [Roseimicrobium sp. ORNL1]
MVPSSRFVSFWACPPIFFGMLVGAIYLTRPEKWSTLQELLLALLLYPAGILHSIPVREFSETLLIFAYAVHLTFFVLFFAIRVLPRACLIWGIYALYLALTTLGWRDFLKQL